MKHVLIVDDERPFLLSVRDGLAGSGGQFQLHLAFDGRQAVEVLRRHTIDLVVTDLKMPGMDGFQLLAYMATHFPGIPVIVMTAFGTQEIEQRLKKVDAFRFLEKPLDLDALANAIEQGLNRGPRSIIRGITLATFLQLVRMESKTCTLTVRSPSGTGKLYIDSGELYDAETGDAAGEAAAYQIVCWPNPEIEMDAVCAPRKKVIEGSLEHILLDAYRMEDERRNVEQEMAAPPEAVETAEPFSVEKAPESSLSLASTWEALRRVPGIRELALFDANGRKFRSFPEPTMLAHLCPSPCLSAAERIGAVLEHGLNCVDVRDRQGRHYLFLAFGKYQVVARLRSDSRVSDTVEQLEKIRRLS